MATVTYIKEAKQHVSAMKAVIRYCQREDKTTDPKNGRRYVTGLNCNGTNAFTEFLATKTAYNKLDGINFYQYVQSFSPKEKITHEQAHAVGLEFAARAWPGHEVQVTTHCDAEHIHTHFVINSVSFETGKKLHQTPDTLRQLRQISDEICMSHPASKEEPDAVVSMHHPWLRLQDDKMRGGRDWHPKCHAAVAGRIHDPDPFQPAADC